MNKFVKKSISVCLNTVTKRFNSAHHAGSGQRQFPKHSALQDKRQVMKYGYLASIIFSLYWIDRFFTVEHYDAIVKE